MEVRHDHRPGTAHPAEPTGVARDGTFVSIGLEVRVASLREADWRPVAVFASATVFNLALALGLASLLFRNVSA
ncbi:hypothetical protein [Micromonospora orduensis]|uniref:hypothetical protein n=1 Tax=Micromonospora orduensis TaxID=1420891 RepID=UPI001ABF392C|nr:hypothetical protein [Micromonospora orduensis]